MNGASVIFARISSTLYTYNWNPRRKEGGRKSRKIPNLK